MENNKTELQPITAGESTLHPKLELPIHGLPKDMQESIEYYAQAYSCPREFVTVAVFSAISTIAGNRVRITDGLYTNTLSLWWVNIAPSGSNKTQPVKAIVNGIVKLDDDLHEQYLHDLAEWNRKEENTGSSPRPQYKTLLVGDMTEESRHSILNNNPNGVLGYYPEVKGFFDDLERYNKGGAISRVLRLWDNDDIKVTRKGEPEPLVIKRPFMNILGDLQPSLLQETFGSKAFMNSGLNQRFLFCFPDDVPFPERKKQQYDLYKDNFVPSCIQALYYNTYENGQPIITSDMIVLSLEADAVYNEYYNKLQQLKTEANDDYKSSLYSKAQIQVLRLAGIIHVIKSLVPVEGFRFDQLWDDTMKYAVECMDYFIKSALKVYDTITNTAPATHNNHSSMSDSEMLYMFAQRFPINNYSLFAQCINKDRSYVFRKLKQLPS